MKTEKAIQVLRDYNLWRRGDDAMEQPDPHTIGEAIDDVLMAIGDMEEEAKLHRGAITGWQNKWERAVDMAAKAEAKLIEERKMAAKELVRWVEAGWKLSAERDKAQADLDEERKEGEEQARLLGMGSEREVDLMAKNRNLERALEKAEAERDLWRETAEGSFQTRAWKQLIEEEKVRMKRRLEYMVGDDWGNKLPKPK
jgi:hypothetical protein